ncbi:MAG: alpha/beta hydrolase, partial [Actinomycetota bacterium]|nr:alpha/beta hydrolase [Actinomycetota bacterium]
PTVASAVLRGLLDEPPLPEDAATLARLTMPALVIGHRSDPLHVLDDARDLAGRLPAATLVEAPSILTYRLRPAELAAHIRRFLATVPS